MKEHANLGLELSLLFQALGQSHVSRLSEFRGRIPIELSLTKGATYSGRSARNSDLRETSGSRNYTYVKVEVLIVRALFRSGSRNSTDVPLCLLRTYEF